MNLGSLCRREVVGIHAGASLPEAAALMCEQHIGSLVVMTGDTPAQVVGIVTDRDLALDALGGSKPELEQRVGAFVRGRPLAVPSSAGVREAAASMEEAGVRRLLVVDDDGGVVGLVSADDLIEALAQDLSAVARALRRGVSRESSARSVYKGGARPRVSFPSFGSVASQ